ncbi:MAG: ATP-dependent RNA helicase HrpA [Pseudomonadales bacterium]|nr:ATP-dependent RNA helicase HrpA [Pseudomonadales bacterium]MCP5357238.1 ATP-dependent RNA helicase HrpA [Pseudomonadales bacterium]
MSQGQGALQSRIAESLLADQHRFRSAFARLSKSKADPAALQGLAEKIDASCTQVALRRASIPAIQYPDSLPVSQRRDDILQAIQSHQVVILAGDTGSGKTTQLPKLCLELGLGAKGLIGHTQPRRIAARSVAARIAEELQVELGSLVGYQVRFTDHTAPGTLVKLMTDGILLAEIQQDRYLNKYEVLIIDEAHERSLNIDFLLGYLKQLLPRRRDLKLIITSATIDVEKFSRHFDDAPIVEVSGRSFPVDVLYRPLESDVGQGGDDPVADAVYAALKEIETIERGRRQGMGDVLIFLSGEREIRDLALSLRKRQLRDTEILPLYARLTPAEQNRIFSPHRGRRIILSTNVAETSLTVPGIVYVIDTGLARISRYSVQSKVQRLPIEPVSQASANQRAGRCGRVSHGTCFRLYSEDDYLGRAEFTDPEIQRTNLSAVILQMLMLGLGDIQAFPFLDRPEQKAINDGFKLLAELGAINRDRRITPTGRQIAALPTDPRLARMLVEAAGRGCLQEMLIIVSALSVQDPRDVPPDKRQAAREVHQQFAHTDSDFLSWVLLWVAFEEQRQALSQNALKKYCGKHYLSYLRMREWRETHRQLHLTCQQLGYRENRRADALDLASDSDYEAVHRAILSGSLNQIGMKGEEGQYLGSRGRRFAIFPTSTLARKGPKWVVTAELIETSRLYATLAARIEPAWAVDAAGDLVRRDYSEPHWEKRAGRVMAFEKISLFGLVLVERQRVSFAAIDPVASREIFIREALVDMQLHSSAAFYRHNGALLAALRKEEEKLRRPDIIVGEDQIYEFYATRIPPGICEGRSLERWLKQQAQQGAGHLLHMHKEDLLQRSTEVDVAHYFPDSASIQNNPLPIHYAFKPGEQDDGAFVDVPAGVLAQMREADLDWMIPGLIRERCAATLKGLPKQVRKQFIPIPDFVDAFMSTLGLAPGDDAPKSGLLSLLQGFIRKKKGVLLDIAELEAVELPAHLRPRIRVLDAEGKELGHNTSLKQLQERFCQGAVTALSESQQHACERTGIREWNFGVLEKEVVTDDRIRITRYPALVDQGQEVAIVLQETAALADRLSRQGVVTLLILRSTQQKRMIQDMLKKLARSLALKAGDLPAGFEEQALRSIYHLAFATAEMTLPRDQSAFERLLNQGKPELIPTAERFGRLLGEIVEEVFSLRRRLKSFSGKEYGPAMQDIEAQLAQLLGAEYLATTPAQYLKEYPRYLKAIGMRLDKLPAQTAKDSEYSISINKIERHIKAEIDKRKAPLAELEELLWAVQELRVSLFAQTLGTRYPVSEKRLEKRLEALRQQGLLSS